MTIATVRAIVTPAGQLVSLDGYDLLKAKVLTIFNTSSRDMRAMAAKQWDQPVDNMWNTRGMDAAKRF